MMQVYLMIEKLAENLINLKKEFASDYNGSSQIQEFLPLSNSDLFPIGEKELKLLHEFAEKNPIYYNSFEKTLGGIPCIVYEGDINKYWLNSIQHNSSHAPFSPTWIMSAYIMTLFAKEYGYSQIIDIGSGDGRIAYCGKIIGLDSYSIELDEQLTDLQKSFIEKNITTPATHTYHSTTSGTPLCKLCYTQQMLEYLVTWEGLTFEEYLNNLSYG